MDEIGRALTELVKQGSPIATSAVYYWYIAKWLDSLASVGIAGVIMAGLYSIARTIVGCVDRCNER